MDDIPLPATKSMFDEQPIGNGSKMMLDEYPAGKNYLSKISTHRRLKLKLNHCHWVSVWDQRCGRCVSKLCKSC